MTRVVDMADPARGEDANELQGFRHGAGVSFIVVEAPPGGGPRLHRHPYEEVFVVQEGTATFTAGDSDRGTFRRAACAELVEMTSNSIHRLLSRGLLGTSAEPGP